MRVTGGTWWGGEGGKTKEEGEENLKSAVEKLLL